MRYIAKEVCNPTAMCYEGAVSRCLAVVYGDYTKLNFFLTCL